MTLSIPNVVDVKYFGAYGDANHDDTSVIQAALDAAGPGGTVVFPSGYYNVTGTLFPHAGQRWVGGTVWGQVRLVWAGDAAGVLVHQKGPQCWYEGITFDGGGPDLLATGVLAAGGLIDGTTWTGYGTAFFHCHFVNCGRGYDGEPNVDDVLQNDTCSFYKCLWSACTYGVYIGTLQSDFWSFEGCNFSGNTNADVNAAVACGAVSFRDCVFTITPTHILVAAGTGGGLNWLFEHCQSEGGPSDAKFLDVTGDISITCIGCMFNQALFLTIGARPFTTIACAFNVGPITSGGQAVNWTSMNDIFYPTPSTNGSLAAWLAATGNVNGEGVSVTALNTGNKEFLVNCAGAKFTGLNGNTLIVRASPDSTSPLVIQDQNGNLVAQVGYQGQIEQQGKLLWRASTYPTSGGRPDAIGSAWQQGDIIFNTAPTPGDPWGWICTAGGTPGTWHVMGV